MRICYLSYRPVMTVEFLGGLNLRIYAPRTTIQVSVEETSL